MVPETDFPIHLMYIQWAIIPMIDGTINNCSFDEQYWIAFDFGL